MKEKYYTTDSLAIFDLDKNNKAKELDNLILSGNITGKELIRKYLDTFHILEIEAIVFHNRFKRDFGDTDSYVSEIGEKCSFRLLKEKEDAEKFEISDFLQMFDLPERISVEEYDKNYSRYPNFGMLERCFPEVFDCLDFEDYDSRYEWMQAFCNNVDKLTDFLSPFDGNYNFGRYEWTELVAVQGLVTLSNYFLYRIYSENTPLFDEEALEETLKERSCYSGFLNKILYKGYRKYAYPDNHLHISKIIIDMGKEEYKWFSEYIRNKEIETNGDFKADAFVPCPPMGMSDHLYNFVMMYQLERIGFYWREDKEGESVYLEMKKKYMDDIKSEFFHKCPVRRDYYKKISNELNIVSPDP